MSNYSNEIEKSFHNFKLFKTEIKEFLKNDISESDTRSKILDELLISVLGWEEVNIVREGRTDGGYFDYKMNIPSFQFIVEAKRNFNEFEFPTRGKSVSINVLLKGNEPVINQIRNYLIDVGLQFGVITNGRQFIIGKFLNSDGKEWKKNKCIIFRDLDDVEERFIEFYNLISREAIIYNNGFRINREELEKGKKIISSLVTRDVELVPNELSSQLTPIIDKLFGEIRKYEQLTDKEIIKECFVENEEIRKNRTDIERLFADLPPKLEKVVPARNTESIKKQIQAELEDDDISIQNLTPPNPIIIVGSKGAGKTTFINYLFNYSLPDDFHKTRPNIYVDFTKYTDRNQIKNNQIIYSDILNSIYEKYPDFNLHKQTALKRIYHKEIKRFDDSIWEYDKNNNPDKYHDKLNEFLTESLKKSENHFTKLSEYLIRERRLRLCLIIDNADQLDNEIQKEVFLFAQSLNRKALCSVIISLREGYYYKWRLQPPFDAFASNVYHITAPPYSEVLQKRIDYVLSTIKLDGKTRGESKSGLKIQLDNQAVKDFLGSVKNSLFRKDNSEMLNFLAKTTYPNIRDGLELFKHFLVSAHTDVIEYVYRHRFQQDNRIPIPIHEFVKAIALDNKVYYNQDISVIHNLFNPENGSRNHFLKIKLLIFLSDKLTEEGYTEKFILIEEILKVFEEAGYKNSDIQKELIGLLKYRLVETADVITDVEENFSDNICKNIAISSKGHYYITELINRLHYFELVLQDTVIYDSNIYSRLKQVYPEYDEYGKKDLRFRKEAVEIFVEYLKIQENVENSNHPDIYSNVIQRLLDNGLSRDLYKITKKIEEYYPSDK